MTTKTTSPPPQPAPDPAEPSQGTPVSPAVFTDLIDAAADRIHQHGLYQGDWFDQDGWHAGTADPHATAVCASAAILLAGGWRPALNASDEVPESVEASLASVAFADWLIAEKLAARKCLHRSRGCRDAACVDAAATIADWNDQLGRTKQQVVDALKACAASLRTRLAVTTLREAR